MIKNKGKIKAMPVGQPASGYSRQVDKIVGNATKKTSLLGSVADLVDAHRQKRRSRVDTRMNG